MKIFDDYHDGSGGDEIVQDVRRLIVWHDEALTRAATGVLDDPHVFARTWL